MISCSAPGYRSSWLRQAAIAMNRARPTFPPCPARRSPNWRGQRGSDNIRHSEAPSQESTARRPRSAPPDLVRIVPHLAVGGQHVAFERDLQQIALRPGCWCIARGDPERAGKGPDGKRHRAHPRRHRYSPHRRGKRRRLDRQPAHQPTQSDAAPHRVGNHVIGFGQAGLPCLDQHGIKVLLVFGEILDVPRHSVRHARSARPCRANPVITEKSAPPISGARPYFSSIRGRQQSTVPFQPRSTSQMIWAASCASADARAAIASAA